MASNYSKPVSMNNSGARELVPYLLATTPCIHSHPFLAPGVLLNFQKKKKKTVTLYTLEYQDSRHLEMPGNITTSRTHTMCLAPG